MSRRFCGVTAWTRASSEITAPLSNTRPAWKELEYAARTSAQSANMRHACRQAGCAAWIEEASRAAGAAALRIRRGLRVSFIRSAQRRDLGWEPALQSKHPRRSGRAPCHRRIPIIPDRAWPCGLPACRGFGGGSGGEAAVVVMNGEADLTAAGFQFDFDAPGRGVARHVCQ